MTTVLVIWEQRHYQKHWWSIQPLLTWTLGFVFNYADLLSSFIYNDIGDQGAPSLSEALKVNSSLTLLDLNISFVNCCCFHFRHIACKMGEVGLSCLCEGLKANSSLIELRMRFSFHYSNVLFPFYDKIENGANFVGQQHHFYQRHWRWIHQSERWMWVFSHWLKFDGFIIDLLFCL